AVCAPSRERGASQARPGHPRRRLSLPRERLSAGRYRLRAQPARRRLAELEGGFFAPAAPALRAAPWIVVRGNHEICRRAGAGYFRLLDPRPADAAPPCVDLVPHFTVIVGGQSFIVLDSSNAADSCPCNSGPYAAEFAGMRPAPGSWLLTHR